jgi:hypothetical protein
MMAWRRIRFSIVIWTIFISGAWAATASAAQTFNGTVTNATTQKPSAGDEVVLLEFSGGLREVARTRSDSNGRFVFKLDNGKPPGMLEVIHQGATYSRVVSPYASSLQLQVYDASRIVKGINVTADVMRLRAMGGSLQAVRVFVVKNESAPPQTQIGEHNFEFNLPEGAQIDHCMARSEGEQPARAVPLSEKQRNLYALPFPLRPGETQFQVLFHMPYSGTVTINPKPVYAVNNMVVMLPNKMRFTAGPGAAFRAMSDPGQNDVIVQVASNTRVGQPLTFTLSDPGTLAETKAENVENVASANAVNSGTTVRESQAAAVAAPPTAAPDPSGKFQWYVLGGLFVLLAAATISIARRSTKRRTPHLVRRELQHNAVPSPATSEPADAGKSFLNDLKEQLFQLEVEHKQRRISQPEYEKALAALQHNLRHAISLGDDKELALRRQMNFEA